MEQLPRNGDFVMRRKMFVDAPFHNRQSYVPLNWREEDHNTQEAERARIRQALQRQTIRRAYEQSVQDRLQRRYMNPAHHTIENDGFRKKNPDSLSRQLQLFNRSKIMESQSPSIKQKQQPNQYNDLPAYPLDGPDLNSPDLPMSHDNTHLNNPKRQKAKNHERTLQSQESFTYRPQRRGSLDASRLHRTIEEQPSFVYNPQGRASVQGHKQTPQDSRYKHQQYLTASRDNSPSLLKNSVLSNNPYPPKNIGKQLEQLYTGSKPQDYQFRNIIPDKLENYLRENTKNDRKRAYHVSLNLFKH